MAVIRDRINVIANIASQRIHIGFQGQAALNDQTLELIFVQFRKVLEGIAFASLAANREQYSKAHNNFSKHWRAKDMLAVMDTINPLFFPTPMVPPVETGRDSFHFDPLTDQGTFTRDDFVFLYKCSSEALHTHNPYRADDCTTMQIRYSINEWVGRLQKLLSWHRTHLVNGEVWVINIPNEGPVTAYKCVPEEIQPETTE